MILKSFFVGMVFLLCFVGCSPKNKKDLEMNSIVIGLSCDVSTLNPLFTTIATEQEIVELLYPSLIRPTVDTAQGTLGYSPSLARSYEFLNKNRNILFHLRTDARWSDSVSITARDVKFSFMLYGNPAVGSVHQNTLQGLRASHDGTPDIAQSIDIINDSTLLFHFEKAYSTQLFDVSLPIFPAHIFEKIPAAELRNNPMNNNPVVAGPFFLASWKPMQEIILQSNPMSVLPSPAAIRTLVFRIIPDSRMQVTQLQKNEIDMLIDIEAADAAATQKSNAEINIFSIKGRRYHFIGWNNIDQQAYRESHGLSIRTHPLFGTVRVRQAMTLAINRNGLLEALLSGYGEIANGPIAPFFHWAYNDALQPHPFNPQKALQLLEQEGWTDTDNDGVLEKNEKRFSFELCIPTGSEFWSNIATIVQKELRDIKIKVKISKVERSVYWQNLLEKKYDAWIAGFEVPMELHLEKFWGSDLKKNSFNIFSYQNNRVNKIVNAAAYSTDQNVSAQSWKEFQQILYDEQPCTFLFWENRLVAVNKKIKGIDVNILGTLQNSYRWSVVAN